VDRTAIDHVHIVSFPTPDEARLVEALRANGRLFLSLVAVDAEGIVGHVAFSPVTVSGAGGGVGLAPLAVLPSFRRRGIGAALVREGLVHAERAGFHFVVVLGEPTYYSRFGFLPAARWALRDEYEGGDAFQALELRPAAVPADGGLVRYAPEFARFSTGDSAHG
jgi:putative acetyltransferase